MGSYKSANLFEVLSPVKIEFEVTYTEIVYVNSSAVGSSSQTLNLLDVKFYNNFLHVE